MKTKLSEKVVDDLMADTPHNPSLMRKAMRDAGIGVSYVRVDSKGNMNARGRVQGAHHTRTAPAQKALHSYIQKTGGLANGEVWADRHSRDGVWIKVSSG